MRRRCAVLAALIWLGLTSRAGATVSVALTSPDPDPYYLPGETITLTVRVTANGGEKDNAISGYIRYPNASVAPGTSSHVHMRGVRSGRHRRGRRQHPRRRQPDGLPARNGDIHRSQYEPPRRDRLPLARGVHRLLWREQRLRLLGHDHPRAHDGSAALRRAGRPGARGPEGTAE